MSSVGNIVKKIVDVPLDLIGLGGDDTPELPSNENPRNLAQEEADKAQGARNSAIARRRKRSLLASGMNTASTAAPAKKLLGE